MSESPKKERHLIREGIEIVHRLFERTPLHPKTVKRQDLLQPGTCNAESKEGCGKNTRITMVRQRHSNRDPGGYLTEYGRQKVRDNAARMPIDPRNYNLLHVISSYKGPVDAQSGLPRSAETANISLLTLVNKSFKRLLGRAWSAPQPKREKEGLEYDYFKTPIQAVYDHYAVYTHKLIEALGDKLTPEQRAEATRLVDEEVVLDRELTALREQDPPASPEAIAAVEKQRYQVEVDNGKKIGEMFSAAVAAGQFSWNELDSAEQAAQDYLVIFVATLDTPLARQYKAECAGAEAYLFLKYRDIGMGMESGASVLLFAGGHGGISEWVLQAAMEWEDEEGNTRLGFSDSSEIGGSVATAEAYAIDFVTDGNGNPGEITIQFFDPRRAHVKNARLRVDILQGLADDFKMLHNLS